MNKITMKEIDCKKMQTAIGNKQKAHEIEMPWKYIDGAGDSTYLLFSCGRKYVAFAELSKDTIEDNSIFIDNFEVCKSWRRTGVGSKAFDAIRAVCRNGKVDSIFLMAKDQKSKMFWKSLGFECEPDDSGGIPMRYDIDK